VTGGGHNIARIAPYRARIVHRILTLNVKHQQRNIGDVAMPAPERANISRLAAVRIASISFLPSTRT